MIGDILLLEAVGSTSRRTGCTQIMNLPYEVFITVAVVVVLYLFAAILFRLINRRIEDTVRRHKLRKSVLYAVTTIALCYIVAVWASKFEWLNLSVVFAAAGAGLVIVCSSPILAIIGWIYIVARRPYDIGDRIEIADVKGDVMDIRLLKSTLLEIGNWVGTDQSTFRVVHIPNSFVFLHPVYNYTSDFKYLWSEVAVVVTFESDWEKARDIMLEHARTQSQQIIQQAGQQIRDAARKYSIHYPNLTPIVYVRIVEAGVELTLRYLTNVRRRRVTDDAISSGILKDFDTASEVAFAYPTYRIVKS